ncbi:PepSY domain-containing protein [Nitrosomonas sp. Nm166]|uniref:PepSY domain-containing protein n=1 Tax=Nitrosomonas sp. Nm166 TaxID=1881054 RepID=UPI0008E38E5D|nr:PepSY domain-containing protein [Nitrosomonas sp. Nm166]SFF18625.1 Peptidase propeptide and YPEB domain-containing protein [Nitrosomonas sp. Nm166]
MSRLRGILVIVMVMTGSATQATAGWQSNASNYYRTSNSSIGISEQKAISIAQQRFKGRVLAINHSDNAYRIKILSNQGTIHIILINATDGTIISSH